MAKLFDYVNSITYNKEDLVDDDEFEKEYVPFVINKALSYYPDTIYHANEMNKYHFLPKQQQYHFYLYSISKKKRWSKWHKKLEDDDTKNKLELIKQYYSYNDEKAMIAMSILTDEQIDYIILKSNKGGVNERS